MDAADIEHNLYLLGEELQEMGVQDHIELLLIGGGFMLTQIKNRVNTSDVDVLVINPDAYSEGYRLLKAAANFIAHDKKLDPAWFSTNIGDFLRIAGPLPHLTLWKQFGHLVVYIPPEDFILAHKLIASRSKDEKDIKILCQRLNVINRHTAQQILDKYIDPGIQQHYEIDKKLTKAFP